MFLNQKVRMTGFLGLLIGLVGGAHGMEIKVGTTAELETALAGVEPGTVIRMAPGEWTGLDLLIRADGTPETPVVLEAATPGTVRLTGETSLRLEGSHIEIRGLHFHEAVVPEGREALITLRSEDGKAARNSRLTELYFERCNPEDLLRKYPWIRMYGKANRVDHSRFEGQAHRGLAIQIRVHEPAPGHRIDHNHFVDRLPGAMSNGYEIIQIGLSEDSLKPGEVIIERNIFERCDGETEIISSKSFSNLIRNNLFLHSSGSVTLRHGDKGSVIDNAFIGGNKAQTGGVRVVGEGNRVSGNSFQGLTGRTGGVIVLYCGIPDSPLNGYFPADNAILEENIFYNNSGNAVYLTGGYGQRNRILLPENILLAGNVFGPPPSGGAVAIAGHLEDARFKDNLHARWMETGITGQSGFLLQDIRFKANSDGLYEPYAVDAGGTVASKPRLTAPEIPHRSEVGPSWTLDLPELVLIDPVRLLRLRNGDVPATARLREEILSRAEAILGNRQTYSVTFNDRLPPSGDRRDYYSTGPYWWPNPETDDGLPYVLRDGEFNPERDRVSDRQPLHDMIHDVRLLATAEILSGDRKYGDWGAELLRVWFLDPETGMRPNLNHAQAIPGRTEGRGTGIIDTHPFTELVDALLLLEHSGALNGEQATRLRAWFGSFTEWLGTSPNAHDERDSLNNHGTAFDMQYAALLWYTGQLEILHPYIEFLSIPRIGGQIEPDGRQPLELARTRTWSYCTENLEHFFKLGLIARKVGIDLFAFESADGANLMTALDYLLPAVCQPEIWPHPQETAWQEQFIRNVLSIATGISTDPALRTALDCLEDEDSLHPFAFLLHPVRGE